MKRFLTFLLFVSLLAIAVGSLQTWKDRRYGRNSGWTNPFLRLVRPDNDQRHPEKYTFAAGPSIDLKDVNVLAAMSRERILLAKAVVPSVVSIVTSRNVESPEYQRDPFYQFFHGKQVPSHGRIASQLGSGAIVSQEGHIVTNNHVIEGMDQIAVKLSDGRELTARLIGTDTDTDVAVLKIDTNNITPIHFGDSDNVEVGETVMAVGNPYGYEESVTQGIISAKGRRGDNVSDLFQIDAAINPGNSGGPLVNVRGELIGLNEAIFSRSGSWQGVGFAIPSSTVQRVVDGILKTGRVIHGYLGIERAMTEGPGVLVNSVVAGSPADKAAILPGDVIQKFNHKPVNDFEDLRREVAEVNVDSTVPVEVIRGGKVVAVNARIAEKPAQTQLSQVPHSPAGLPPGGPSLGSGGNFALPPGHPSIGPGGVMPGLTSPADLLEAVKVREITGEDVRKLNLPTGTAGIKVMSVAADSAAADKLQPGDVIETVNQENVGNLVNYAKLMRAAPADQPLVMSIIRSRSRTLVVISRE